MKAREFWEKWLKANPSERMKMMYYIARNIEECNILRERKRRIHCIANLLLSYFLDFEKVITSNNFEGGEYEGYVP
ncbi:MAG: hypothetical protein DRO40_06650 [Thermoprotei archaeon]|nr:MAG: hypothetical protein DRO40_06650 [Thermoprotei archaeon]